ncbi:MAG TPA: substrate-binding domain-containing protein, partial [Anaerolineae bacterium]
RTYGGASTIVPAATGGTAGNGERDRVPLPDGFLTDRANVLIVTPIDPRLDRILTERAVQQNVPLIAESLTFGSRDQTLVAVDNYEAAAALGRWAGRYAQEHFAGRAAVLDLTYDQQNTAARSRGFVDGLRGVLPSAQLSLSIDAGSSAAAAYQLTADALTVHPEINVVFAINDATAQGALRACAERGVDPEALLLLTFGLEGETLRRILLAGGYCKAGLAMFPEVVGPVCVEAAIAAYNGQPLPQRLVTPHAVLTAETLGEFYEGPEEGCRIKWDAVTGRLAIPIALDPRALPAGLRLPQRVGFVVPFMEHEWYRALIACMREYAGAQGVELEAADAAQLLSDDLAARQLRIAQVAAEQVQPGEVLLLEGGPINLCLAEALATRPGLTVITNSLPIFQVLRDRPNITLISTGGLLAPESETLVGPTAVTALRELRADKLFLSVTGVSLSFGLSHANLGEVGVKQAMIRAAREVILLADHTRFGLEAVGQIAPATAVHRLITDNALPASTRLELSKLGITVIIAKT